MAQILFPCANFCTPKGDLSRHFESKKTSNLLIKLQLEAFPFSFERGTGWIALFGCARIHARTRRFYWTHGVID
jgi:hypothetical protein